MKYLNLLFALLFAVFTAVQYNDPDSLIWMILYGYLTVLFIMGFMGKFVKPAVWVGLAICIIGAFIHVGGLYEFLTNHDGIGFSQGMSNEYPYIEKAREFGGLVIGGLAMWFLFWQMRKNQA